MKQKNDVVHATFKGLHIFKATITSTKFVVVKWISAVPQIVGYGVQPVLQTRSDTNANLKIWLERIETVNTPELQNTSIRNYISEVIYDRGTEMEDRNGNRKR